MGRASARDSSVVTNFLDGRRRLRGLIGVLEMRFRKAEDLMVRLSRFVEANWEVRSVKDEEGRVVRPEPEAGLVLEVEVLVRIECRAWGAVGAWEGGC